MEKFDVSILIGSQSDYSIIEEAISVLDKFSIKYKLTITSAHRTPERTEKWVKYSEEKGVKVFIVAAGAAAHLKCPTSSISILFITFLNFSAIF
jgi:5-(carboxyamino)imidazole ribonucleotide mutase